jgi:hypothetical protein
MARWLMLLVFLGGVAIGAAGALYGPRLAAPYLPEMLRPTVERLDGEVVRKKREKDRLLMTVVTARGAILASFRVKVAEIDLLVDEGDSVTLSLPRYEPFVNDPSIAGVRKIPRTTTPEGATPAPAPEPPLPATPKL